MYKIKNIVMSYVPIASFLLHKNEKVLVEKRSMAKKQDPGITVLPSGHVEEGETFEEACERELKEETGLECKKFNFIVKYPHITNTGKELMIYFYSCEEWEGEPYPYEAEKLFWIGLDELDFLDSDIDKKAIRKLFNKN